MNPGWADYQMLVEMATVLTSLALATVGGPMLVALSFGCDNSIGIQGSTDKGYGHGGGRDNGRGSRYTTQCSVTTTLSATGMMWQQRWPRQQCGREDDGRDNNSHNFDSSNKRMRIWMTNSFIVVNCVILIQLSGNS
jgi:hypothetical protein